MPDLTDSDLDDPRRLAIAALLTGSTHAEAGKAAGVTRQTVTGWVNHDEAFMAALEAERAEIASGLRREILNDCKKALRVLSSEMAKAEEPADRIRAASRILDLAPDDVQPKLAAAAAQHGPTVIVFEPARVPGE